MPADSLTQSAFWRHELHQSKQILLPVICNQLLTLAGWHFVYDCQTNPDSFALYLLDSKHNFTTGSDFYDGAVNGVLCVSLLAAMSFFMLFIAVYNFRRLIQLWLSASCLLIVFGVSAMFVVDALKALRVTEDAVIPLAATLVALYGTGGIFVFFSERSHLALHQVYVVCNCSLVSIYYLRMLPAHTTWFLLGAIIVWDAFAVLAPHGPLNLITDCAENYSDNVLKFLMFTAEIDPAKHGAVAQTPPTAKPAAIVPTVKEASPGTPAADDDCKTAESVTDEFIQKLKSSNTTHSDSETTTDSDTEEDKILDNCSNRTARDALEDDNSIRLGLGDFVFYSVLVGKAAANGSLIATIAAMLGVLAGLVITLTVFSGGDETMPALPCSIALGMVFHFVTLYGLEPLFYFVSHILVDAFLSL